MKTDSLLYRLFKTAPIIFFDLIGESQQAGYEFRSVELKQTAHRIDGIFLPPDDRPDLPIYFAEFQFQKDPLIYHRLFAEIFLYLEQYPTVQDWQAVVIFPRTSLEPKQTGLYTELLQGDRVQRFYLNKLPERENLPLSLGLLRLVVSPRNQAPQLAKRLVQTSPHALNLSVESIIELVVTSLVYKFPNLTREEIMQMLELATEAKQTRFYQDALQEGERSLILRQLTRRLGTIAPEIKTHIETLTIEQLEDLGEALLDFQTVADLEVWLAHPRD